MPSLRHLLEKLQCFQFGLKLFIKIKLLTKKSHSFGRAFRCNNKTIGDKGLHDRAINHGSVFHSSCAREIVCFVTATYIYIENNKLLLLCCVDFNRARMRIVFSSKNKEIWDVFAQNVFFFANLILLYLFVNFRFNFFKFNAQNKKLITTEKN